MIHQLCNSWLQGIWVDPAPRVSPASKVLQGKAPHVLNNQNTGLTRASHDGGLPLENFCALKQVGRPQR